MALVYTEIFAQSFMRPVSLCAIIPAEESAPDASGQRSSAQENCPLKTLYLLHGLYGCHTDWLTLTNIRRYAAEKHIAVIMPAAENAFYIDGKLPGQQYGAFVGDELIRLTRRLFHLSAERDDTVIAGLSMGGAGAIRTACLYPQNFGAAAGISSAFLTREQLSPKHPVFTPEWAKGIFGSIENMESEYKNAVLTMKKSVSKRAYPQLSLECGVSDSFISINRDFHRFLQEQGVEHYYEESPGGHEWSLWDSGIKKVITRFFKSANIKNS